MEAQTAPHKRRLVLPTLIRIIAISQVWGAATGTWPVIQGLTAWGPGTPLAAPLLLFGRLLFYTFLGTTALFVLRGRESALFYLAAAQLPQLVQLQTPDFVYRVLAGAFVLLHDGSRGFGIEFGVMSTASIRWGEARRFPLRAAERLGPHDDSTP